MRPLRGAGQIPKTVIASTENNKKSQKADIIEPSIDELPKKSGKAAEIGKNIKKIEGQNLPRVLSEVIKTQKGNHLIPHIRNAVLLQKHETNPSNAKMGRVMASLLGRASINNQGGSDE